MSNNNFELQTPVLFLVFNRLDTTKQVFGAIRQAKPPRLYVASDGARSDREGELEKVQEVRDYITNNIDWDCEVKTLFREQNLGCRVAVSGAIDWFFEKEEQGIILEDDCLPDQSFFEFCESMLNHYCQDKRIMLVTGTNDLIDWKSDIQSYHFSYYGSIWGWASWRRAWKYYDAEMSLWENNEIKNRIRDVLVDEKQYKYREKICEKTYKGEINSWGYVWTFSRLLQSGLSIVPSINLISNIGFGEDATHTKSSKSSLANFVKKPMQFPLKINLFVAVDRMYDNRHFEKHNPKINILTKAINKFNRVNGNIFKFQK